MNTQSASKNEQRARVSLRHGMLSVGLLIIIFPITLINPGGGAIILFLCVIGPLFFGSLTSSLFAITSALTALSKNRTENNDVKIKRAATLGLVLGSISPLVLVLWFVLWGFSAM